MGLKPLLAAAMVALSLGLGACGGSGSDSTDDGTTPATAGEPSGEARESAKVKIVNSAYQPDPVVIQVGGKVTWRNEDRTPHNATDADETWDSGIIEQGETRSKTFDEPGIITIYCEFHPTTMEGTIEVVE